MLSSSSCWTAIRSQQAPEPGVPIYVLGIPDVGEETVKVLARPLGSLACV